MSPALLAAWSVCRDRLLDAGASPEMVERMTRADDLCRLLAAAVDQQEGQDCPYCGSNHSNGRDLSCTECGWYSVAARLVTQLAPLRTVDEAPSAPRKDTP